MHPRYGNPRSPAYEEREQPTKRLNTFYMTHSEEVETRLIANSDADLLLRHQQIHQQHRDDFCLPRCENPMSGYEEREQPTKRLNTYCMPHPEEGEARLIASSDAYYLSQRQKIHQQNLDDFCLPRCENPMSGYEKREQPTKNEKPPISLTKNQGKWDARFKELSVYKEKFGHCKISSKEKKYTALRNWLGKQREAYKAYYRKDSSKAETNAAARKRFHKLQMIGVSLEPFSTNWNCKFQELILFQRKHGHCKVPQQGNSTYTRLGQWLGRQKKDLRPVSEMARRCQMSFTARDIERGRLLESVGVRLGE